MTGAATGPAGNGLGTGTAALDTYTAYSVASGTLRTSVDTGQQSTRAMSSANRQRIRQVRYWRIFKFSDVVNSEVIRVLSQCEFL